MKALILAAGLGSRLQHETAKIPKAMVSINGIPIISYQINALIDNNIFDVGVVLGYKANILKKYLIKNHANVNFSFYLNKNFKHSNSAYSFYVASDFIKDESYIHLNCDILFSKDLLRLIIANSKSNIIAVNFNQEVSNNMEIIETNNENQIIRMDNMLFEGSMGKAYGLAKLSSRSSHFILNKLVEYHKIGDFNQNYYGIIRQAVNKISYFAQDASGYFLSEVNTLTDLLNVNTISKKNNNEKKI